MKLLKLDHDCSIDENMSSERNLTLFTSGIAVDWINSNLYWTEMDHKQVWVSKLDGSFQKIILDTLSVPRGIVVDPIRRYVTRSFTLLLLTICHQSFVTCSIWFSNIVVVNIIHNCLLLVLSEFVFTLYISGYVQVNFRI